VLTALLDLQGHCPDAVLDMTRPGGFGTQHAPLVWNIEEDSAPAVLEAVAKGEVSWGMLFWVALMGDGAFACCGTLRPGGAIPFPRPGGCVGGVGETNVPNPKRQPDFGRTDSFHPPRKCLPTGAEPSPNRPPRAVRFGGPYFPASLAACVPGRFAGVACLAGAGLFAVKLPRLRAGIRPVYVRLGVLPPVTAGIQTAAELSRPPEG
jgi:hypothetical protein